MDRDGTWLERHGLLLQRMLWRCREEGVAGCPRGVAISGALQHVTGQKSSRVSKKKGRTLPLDIQAIVSMRARVTPVVPF